MPAHNRIVAWAMVSLLLMGTTLAHGRLAVRWGHQLVTPTKDTIFGTMTADSSDNIYIVVSRRPDNSPKDAPKDRFLMKFSQDGGTLWSKQLGSNDSEAPVEMVVAGLTADEHENLYAFGHTGSALAGESQGGYDAFFVKFDRDGKQIWVRQVGTPEHDVCTGLAIDDSNNLYIAGYTYGSFATPNKGSADLFVAAYDPQGALLWRDQMGTAADDRAADIRLGHDGDLYICGTTAGSLTKQTNDLGDLLVARYDRSGGLGWFHQYGTEAKENAICMVVSELGHVTIGGITYGDFASKGTQRGRGDAYVARVAKTGELLWVRQFGSRFWDQTWDLARFSDGSGDILAGGCQIPSGVCQGFCRRYSPEGELVWTKEFRQRSIQGGTCGRVVAVDGANHCYHAGVTNANQFGTNNGTGNIYIVRFDEEPAPAPRPGR